MKIMSATDIFNSDVLICTFGGSGGGYSYHYRLVRLEKWEQSTIVAQGYPMPPSHIGPRDLFCLQDRVLYHFRVPKGITRELPDKLRYLLLKDRLESAKTQAKQLARTEGRPVMDFFKELPCEKIVSCGHWHYAGAANVTP